MDVGKLIYSYVEKVHFPYMQALEDFIAMLGASEDNIGEYALIDFPMKNIRGVYRNGKLVGAVYAVNSGDRTFIICQDMRHATD
jgi:hypothetical protein